MGALSMDELAAALATLPGWSGDNSGLRRTLRFPHFADAIAFMTDCTSDIERMDHHPDWRNVYDRVDIRLSTHDAGDQVTAKDVDLARLLDRHASSRNGR